MKPVKIYQLKSGVSYKFRSYLTAKEKGLSMDDYFLVYDCNRRDDCRLDDIYYEFNCHHPEDFRGHSLSISDIVELDGVKWYCDDIGWSRILDEV